MKGYSLEKIKIQEDEIMMTRKTKQELIAQIVTMLGMMIEADDEQVQTVSESKSAPIEMLGLEWKDVDFKSSIISIRRTSNYTAERGIYTDTTKTKRSQRTLKISQFIMDILKQLREEQDEQALKYGDKWVESDRLFVKWNGEPMNNQTPYGWLKEFCEKNELPFYGIHSFRHFAASALISAGLDVTTVSGALGHSNSTTTLNVYSHQFDTAQARVSEAMDSAFDFLKNRHRADR